MTVSVTDLDDIVNLLTPSDLHSLYHTLGITSIDVEKWESEADPGATSIVKAKKVLELWHRENGHNATRQAILQGLEKCGNRQGKEDLEKGWRLKGPKFFHPSQVLAALHLLQEYSSQTDAEQRLVENCRQFRLTFHGDTPADGNCFFHAVSDQLHLLGLKHQSAAQLRKSVVEFLRSHPSVEGPDGIVEFSSTQPDWNAYLESMSRDGEWADAIILVAMAHMLRHDILVVTSSPQGRGNQAYQWIVGDADFKETPIMLGHVWEWHYKSLGPTLPSLAAQTSTTPLVSSLQQNFVQNQQQSSQLLPHSLHEPAAKRRKFEMIDRSSINHPVLESMSFQPNLSQHQQQVPQQSIGGFNVYSQITEFGIDDVIQRLGPSDLKKLYLALGISHQDVEKAEEGANTKDVELKARAVFRLWLQRNAEAATYQAILQALEKCRNIEAKDTLENSWNGKGVVSSESNLDDVIQSLGPDQLQKLYHTLGISQQDIEKAEEGANTKDVELKARAVFRLLLQRKGKEATHQAILQALQECSNKVAKEETPTETFDVASLKDTLIEIYHKEAGHIINLPWNENVHGRREMEDIFVELQLEMRNSQKDGKQGLERYTDLVKLTDTKGHAETRILLKGLAGSGKSTLMSKLAHDWSKQENGSPLNKYELLFLLRMNALQTNYSLIDAIYDQILEFIPAGLKEYILQNAEKVLILFDGWDESNLELNVRPSKEGKAELKVELIIRNDVLRKSCVIVSTRPHKQLKHHTQSKFYLSVNVEGFSDENIMKYVKFFFNESDTEVRELHKKLQKSRNLKSISKIPVLLMMLCTLWDDRQHFPETVSLLYKEFIEIIWERFIQKEIDKSGTKFTNNTFEELQYHLGRVALEGLIPITNVKDNILEFPEDKFSGICELGLVAGTITRQRWKFKLKEKSSISFLHKSVQEFFAGRYLVSLFDSHQFHNVLNRIDNFGLVVDKIEVLKFGCGLSQYGHSELAAVAIIEHVISVICDNSKGGRISHHITPDRSETISVGDEKYSEIQEVLTLLFESQIKENDKLLLAFKSLTALDYLRVFSPSSLSFFDYFVKCKFGKTLDRIKSVFFHNMPKDSLDIISDTLHLIPEAESAVIEFNKKADNFVVKENTMTQFAKNIGAMSKLSKLVLTDFFRKYKFHSGVILHHLSLSPNRIMQYLDLSGTHIGNAIIHMGVIITPHLQYLDLSYAALDERHIKTLSPFLSNAPNITYLDLSGNTVGNNFESLFQHLQQCHQLVELKLENTSLPVAGFSALANIVHHFPNIEELGLGSNHASNNAIDFVFKHMFHLIKLLNIHTSATVDSHSDDLVRYFGNIDKSQKTHLSSIYEMKNNAQESSSVICHALSSIQQLQKETPVIASSSENLLKNVEGLIGQTSLQKAEEKKNWPILQTCGGYISPLSGPGLPTMIASIEHVIDIHPIVIKNKTINGSSDSDLHITVGDLEAITDILPVLILLNGSHIKENDKLLLSFKSLISLDHLKISNMHSYTLPVFHSFVKSTFAKATLNRIKSIVFENHTKDSLDVISETLHLMPDVESVKITFGDKDLSVPIKKSMTQLGESIGALSKLSKLVISDSYGKPKFDASDVLHHLSQSPSGIMKHLEVWGTHIGDAVSYMGAITPYLEWLDLCDNALEERHIETLSAFLSKAPNLIALRLSGCTMGNGVVQVSHHLQNCHQLSWLDLSQSNLTDAGVTALAENFHHFTKLQTLVLSDDDRPIGNIGLDAVLRHIQNLTELTDLWISATVYGNCSDLVKECLPVMEIEPPVGAHKVVFWSLHLEEDTINSLRLVSRASSMK